MMKERLQNIKDEALKAIEAADMPEKLNDVRVKFLGKKGELTAVLKGMKDVAPEDRPKVGQMVNETRAAIEAVLEENKEKMEKAIRAEKLKKEVIDVTLPAKKNCVGHRHPNTIALEEVERIFSDFLQFFFHDNLHSALFLSDICLTNYFCDTISCGGFVSATKNAESFVQGRMIPRYHPDSFCHEY